jgi:peptidoglycan hydrolase-like protein with peptidoglycan-binding domain
MGFYSGEPIDNSISNDFTHALRRFQTFYDLTVTGVLDAPTQRKLEEMHGF